MRSTIAVFVVVLLCACDGATEPLNEVERAELSWAKGRWRASGPVDYTMEQRRLCFCPPTFAQWARVTVRSGVVTAAALVDSGEPIAASGRVTVPQLFEIIENLRGDRHLSDIRVEYNEQYGYPTLIEVTHEATVADGGLTIQTRALFAGS